MATTLLLLAMIGFVAWACVHTNARISWYQDEIEAEAFIAELRATDTLTCTISLDTSAWDRALAEFRAAAPCTHRVMWVSVDPAAAAICARCGARVRRPSGLVTR